MVQEFSDLPGDDAQRIDKDLGSCSLPYSPSPSPVWKDYSTLIEIECSSSRTIKGYFLACLPASHCAERTQNAFALHTLVGARLRQSE